MSQLSPSMNQKYSGQLNHRRGFTLVELLVVVSIIALLISILLPSLRKAREQAKLVVCSSGLSGASKASVTYAADDASEMVIPVPPIDVLQDAPGHFEWGGKAGSGSRSNLADPTSSRWGTAQYRGPAHRPLNRYLYKAGFKDYNPIKGAPQPGPANANWIADTKLDLPAFKCPSDTGYAGGGFAYKGGRHRDYSELPLMENKEGLASAYDFYGNSYVANCFFVGVSGGGNPLTSNSPYLQPLSRIPSPGNTLAYIEVPGRMTWLWGSWAEPSCSWTNRESLCIGNFKEVPGWHKRPFEFVAGFADGHGALVEIKGCLRPSPTLSNCRSYGCNGCIVVRGSGWQMDTLPAPGVRTPWYN